MTLQRSLCVIYPEIRPAPVSPAGLIEVTTGSGTRQVLVRAARRQLSLARRLHGLWRSLPKWYAGTAKWSISLHE